MLHQEINLYRPFEDPRPTSSFSAWRLLWLSSALFLIFLLALYLFTLWDVRHLKKENIRTQAYNTYLKQQFLSLKNNYPAVFFSSNLEQSIGELHESVGNQGKIFQSLTNATPFSQDLLALSRVIAANVWLTDILITKSGDSLTLTGKSIDMDNLQNFLANVAHENLFTGFNVNVNSIANTNNDVSNKNLAFEINIAKKMS